MHSIYWIQEQNFCDFINRLSKDCAVFVPAAQGAGINKETDYSYQKISGPYPHLGFNPYRTSEPLKSFFTLPIEKACGYFNPSAEIPGFQPGDECDAASGGNPQIGNSITREVITKKKGAPDFIPGGSTPNSPELEDKKVIVLGVKSCDLAGHKIQDFVFLEGPEVDSLYRLRRENTILVSSDCTDFKSVCHCLAWEILPYPREGFDLNLSPLNDGYLVEAGSARGEGLIREGRGDFIPAKDTQISARNTKREALIDRLKRHLLPQNLVARDSAQALMRQGHHLDTWKQFMLTCVECGGCNFICDTCHCFLLADRKRKDDYSKTKMWDSCQYANYARVAGGANPLKMRAQRLKFRFTKKFDFFVDNLGMPACCGCGRCIEVCPGKIDIREVLKDLAKRLKQ